jgi:hypothetical protein
LLGEVIETSTVAGGGPVPFPPFAHPLAKVRLANATANSEFFIMIQSRETQLSEAFSASSVGHL